MTEPETIDADVEALAECAMNVVYEMSSKNWQINKPGDVDIDDLCELLFYVPDSVKYAEHDSDDWIVFGGSYTYDFTAT